MGENETERIKQDLRDADEHARECFCDGYRTGGQEAWDILGELLDDGILHKVFGSTEKIIYKKWPTWEKAKEQVLEFQRNEHQRELKQKVIGFINFMVQSGFTKEEINVAWEKESNKVYNLVASIKEKEELYGTGEEN